MYYSNRINPYNMRNVNYRSNSYPNNYRYNKGFLFPFALGFVSSPLIFGATRPRPIYPGPYGPPGSYFPYY